MGSGRFEHGAHSPTLRLRRSHLWQHSSDMPASVVLEPLLRWYGRSARPLPWRRSEATPWEILVSEVMLQQTPVARVLPVYDAWVRRWPTPAALASDAPGEAVRMWGRLGYPRRALRLHEAATAIERDCGGEVPATYQQLVELPGVGDYTAAAVAAFAYSEPALVLDTNVRRVLGRLFVGRDRPARSVSAAERRQARSVLPEDGITAAAWSVAVMELGAVICTARTPHCPACPVSDSCAWRRSGYPASQLPPPRAQRYAGTDRQTRGRILALVRESSGPVAAERLESVSADASQRERALRSLLDDGLVVEQAEGALTLPGRATRQAGSGRELS
jgi:A/G-specific adenine glycosylase